MTLHVRVDKTSCLSSGRCVADEPTAFAFDDDELAEPRPGAGDLPRERLVRAARNCPAQAIEVRDEAGAIAL